jgi:hypothetical protein
MKRLLLLAVVLALVILPVSGISLTFQDSGEFVSYVTVKTAPITWVQSANGGNSYLGGGGTFMNTDPLPMTYAAATNLDGGGLNAQLIDSSGLIIMDTLGTSGVGRYEIKVVGGTAYLYRNGILADTSPPLTQNPSYVAWQSVAAVDDVIWGDSENRYIFGSPQQGYFIKKDMINPAASGFCFPNGTVISSYNMTTTWGFGDSNASQTVQLKDYAGSIYGTYATNAGTQNGSINWPIYDDIINSGAPYGYYVTTIAGSSEYSEVIPYIGYGASIAFDRDSYARGDNAIVTYSVDAGGYWDTAVYSYRLDTLDVYGNVVDTRSVTSQTGAKNVAFATSDPLGVYYTVLIATPIAGGSDIWMNYDYAELTGYLVFTGNVYDAETEAVIPVANVSIVQGTTAYNKVTSADGNYTTNAAFYSGSSTSINVTASGYRQYTNSFTPLDAKTIGLNFTLLALTPTHTGIALGGIARDTVYGRPIALPSVIAANATHAESYSTTGNSVGYYLIDEADAVFFTADRCYTVTGSKTGYGSASYLKCLTAV